MMLKQFFTTFNRFLALSVITVLLTTACSSKDVGEQSTVSPSAAADSRQESPLQLIWLTVDYWVEDSMTESRLAAVNQRIHELGYDFEVVFEGISDETYDTYQNGITRAKKNEWGDLMWTGLGNENDPNGEGSYYRQIRLGNLLPLDDWLQTDMGDKLKEKYSPLEWKRITYKNQIYGVRNIKEQGIFTSLILTGDQMQEESSILKGKTDITVTELCQWLEDYRKDPEHKFYLDWRYVDDEYNVSFAEVGYIKLCDGIYMTPEGKMENVWENEDVCRLWTGLSKMEQAGQLECDDSDSLGQVRQGEYPAAFINVTSENMDGSYLYQEDGSKVQVESHAVTAPYLNHIENDVHGVTSWSQHPEEAMQLLTLVNTDQKLANLLYFGREGIDYQIKDGKVTSENHTDTYCPSNPKLTSFSLYEAESENKEAYYKKANERYQFSPADGFVPNLKQAGADHNVLQRVELFYKDLLEGNGEPEKMIRDFQKELRSKKYGKVLEKIQKQYNKWKKRKKNEK